MTKLLSFLMLMTLVGCTSDHYTANVSQERMKADLEACHKQAFDHFHAVVRRDPSGAIIGGVLGGAIGGVIAGSIADSGQQKPDIDKDIRDCMVRKGYAGYSKGYN